MSGHSKWSTIKRKKGAEDAKRGQLFTRLGKDITVAAKQGGGDPDANPTLRLALEKAREARMPKDNIDRAIAKGTGENNDANTFYEVIYEGFGPNGEAFYMKGLTDNRNRTVSEIRMIFSKLGGSLGGAGSTAYIFAADPENPSFSIQVNDANQARILTQLLEELDDNDDIQNIYVNFDLPNNE